jgi:hypothetical protein
VTQGIAFGSGSGRQHFFRSVKNGLIMGTTFIVFYGVNQLYRTHTNHLQQMQIIQNTHVENMEKLRKAN